MKYIQFAFSLLVTAALVYALNRKWGAVPPMGKFLSPQQGIWKNKDKEDDFKNADLHFDQLKGKVTVHFDKRLVPHVFAENDADAYFVQGYLHARYRLWQMEFQTYYAAGRLSEIVGEKALPLDRKFRRLGMVYAAENSIRETEKDPMSKMATDSYTAGVNAYIKKLRPADLPLEYKILDYQPEPWTNLKTALLLKYMSFDLSGYEEDFERENTKAVFSKLLYETIYQYGNDSLSPIAPMNTIFSKPGITLKVPKNADSAYFNYKNNTDTDIKDISKPDKSNGSNNWAVSGSRTKSGKPILCNDPHLSLNLPSLWYEMQLHTPSFNSYGASLPGTPAIIIGFNDSCAFGFTNAMRDVRDYYEIKFKDAGKKEYWFNNQWQTSTLKFDTIKIKGAADFIDTIAYVKEFGPVMYDASFRGLGLIPKNANGAENLRTSGKNYAVRWIAHDPSNELKTFLLLNRSKNFKDYEQAISTYVCPGQNMIFACNSGDIAIKQQGVFPAKWLRQGDFPMPGFDSTYMWQGMIPQSENYMIKNPDRGFISSANQYPYDTKTYPYYLGGNYPFTRGLYINQRLEKMTGITPADMQQLQNDNFNIYAKMMLPVLVQYCNEAELNTAEKNYLETMKKWNLQSDIKETGATVFYVWNDSLESLIWSDELAPLKNYAWPQESTLYDALRHDTAMAFIDNINTPEKENLRQMVTKAFKVAAGRLAVLEKEGKLEWGKYKATMVKHLMDAERKLPLSRYDLPIGGGENIINATKKDHGPSWKMVVQLTDKVEAYGVYPGGQSGNPGSAYYDNFLDTWASGKYYKLWLMQESEKGSADVLFALNFSK